MAVACGDNGDGGGKVNCPPGGVGNTQFEAQEPFSLAVEVGNQALILLDGINGEIIITGAPGAASVDISATKRVQSESDEDAEAHLQELDVDVQDSGGQIRVSTRQPQCSENRNYIVDYMITVPDDFEVRVNNVNGLVTVESVKNDVSVNNVSGIVTLRDIQASAAVDMVSGTIDAEVTLPTGGSIDLYILTGDIFLGVPADTSADFSASVSLGTITVSNLVLQDEAETPTSLTGTLGTGQGAISLEIGQVGDITVSGL